MASLEDKLVKLQDEVVEEYFAMLKEAEAHRPQETTAAVRIQSAWRGFFLRCNLRQLEAKVTCIQRMYRGHLGRKYAAACRRKRDHELRMAYFNANAAQIQRHFRGFYSRKYKHSYYARAAYISAVLQKTEQLRAQLQESYEKQTKELEEAERQRATDQYRSVLQKSHHLVSTQVCPGVFQTARHSHRNPLLNGMSVEEHLWESVHRSLSSGKASTSQQNQTNSLGASRNDSASPSTPHSCDLLLTNASTRDLPRLKLELGSLKKTRASNSSRGAGSSVSELIQRASEFESMLGTSSPGTERSSYLSGRSSRHAHSPSSRLSVQAASAFSALEAATRLERDKSAQLAISNQPFLTAVKSDRSTPVSVNGAGISEGTRYGIDEEQRKLEKQFSERLMRQISPEPFKVAARARQLFDKDAAERVIVL